MWKIFYSLTDHMTIWGIRIAQWTTKATNTHSQYVIFISFPLQQGLHERGLILRYSYIACPVSLTCSPLNVFASEFNFFGIKLHVFLTPLLVNILCVFFFNFNIRSLPTDVSHPANVSLKKWSMNELQYRHFCGRVVIHVTSVSNATHCFPGR